MSTAPLASHWKLLLSLVWCSFLVRHRRETVGYIIWPCTFHKTNKHGVCLVKSLEWNFSGLNLVEVSPLVHSLYDPRDA